MMEVSLSSLTQDLTEKLRLLLMKTVPAVVYTTPDGTRFIYQKQYDKAKQSLTPEQAIEVWSKISDNIRTKIHIMIWNIYFTLIAMKVVIILTIQQKMLNREYGENSELKDFADSVGYYATKHDEFAKLFPERTKLLNEFLK